MSPTTLTAGQQHTCSVLMDGTVKCWGYNGFGELGNGTTMASTQPVQVLSVIDAVGIAAGFEFSCALVRGGTARCWGEDDYGELGDGIHLPVYVSTPVPTPTQVSGVTNAIMLAGGGSTSDAACALLSDGTVACWGIDISGELGNGVIGANGDSSTPVVVPDLKGVVSIAGGSSHNCALLPGGTVKCWGGVLGTGADMDVSTPIPVPDVVGATALAAGAGHTCALMSAATVECWGANDYGELGYPTTATCLNAMPCSLAAMAVPSLTGVTALAAGSTHTCALLSDRTVTCWGRNDYGQLGNGTTSDSSTPVPVTGLSAVAEIAAGEAHTCARIADGSVRCWGWNSSGQLGNGTTTDSPVPVTRGILNSEVRYEVGVRQMPEQLPSVTGDEAVAAARPVDAAPASSRRGVVGMVRRRPITRSSPNVASCRVHAGLDARPRRRVSEAPARCWS